MMTKTNRSPLRITLGMSGASGMIYGMRLLQCLLNRGQQVSLVLSDSARAVLDLETDWHVPAAAAELKPYLQETFAVDTTHLRIYNNKDWTASIASGSSRSDAMVICPCSSGSIAAIAHGASDNLLERAADVMLKENKPLLLVHRETPLSVIHLENLLKLAKSGATIIPASPGFYHKPDNINGLVDFIVARILDHLSLEHDLIPRWGED